MNRTMPCCGHKISVHTELKAGGNHVLPKKGDATVCFNCGSWHRYTDDKGGMRPFSQRDIKAFPPEVIAAMRRTTRMIKKRGRTK